MANAMRNDPPGLRDVSWALEETVYVTSNEDLLEFAYGTASHVLS